MIFNQNAKLVVLQLYNYMLLLSYVIIAEFVYSDFLIIAVSTFLLMGCGTIIGLHRYFTHNSFNTSAWKRKLLIWLATLSGLGSIVTWSAVHLKHHAKTDLKEDPHSPVQNHPLKVWFGNFFNLYSNIEKKYFVTSLRNNDLIFYHHYYFVFIAMFMTTILILFGWKYLAIIYAIPQLLTLHASSCINVLGHMLGKNTYNLNHNAKDNFALGLLILGEGWHNTHHYNPSLSRLHKYDISGILIEKFFERNK